LLDGLAGLTHRSYLQEVAEYHQCHDHSSGFEIRPDCSVVFAELLREYARHKHCGKAEQVGEPHPQSDQGVHVKRMMGERQPELAQDRPPDPQYDRRAQYKLNPAAWSWLKAKQVMDADHRRHREHHERE
jgi:hypothetical protein